MFLRYVASNFSERSRGVDVVFDRYQKNSIEDRTRAKRTWIAENKCLENGTDLSSWTRKKKL